MREVAMSKRYYIELSKKDRALVSYFSGFEIKDRPEVDWIQTVLVPALEPVARRKNKKIRETPITFWFVIRKTARRASEIFLFMTPACPGTLIEQAVAKALELFVDGKVHAGQEPLPEGAFPALQILRGKIIRFYGTVAGHEGFSIGTVWWEDNKPIGYSLSASEDDELFQVPLPLEKMDMFLAEARIVSKLANEDGNECRKFQQALIPVARGVD
jgi:hypothetical protein